VPSLFSLSFKALDENAEGAYRDVDVAVVAVSPRIRTACLLRAFAVPPERLRQRAKKVLAEVTAN